MPHGPGCAATSEIDPRTPLAELILGGYLSKEDLNELLGDLGTIGSRTKSDAIDRLLRHPHFDPRNALAFLDVASLAEVCRQRGLSDTGKRAALLNRLWKSLLEESPELRTRLGRKRGNELPRWWTLLHPVIASVAAPRYSAGQLADAVEAALKEVNHRVKGLVRELSGQELDGAALMNYAFSPNDPVLLLADLETESGRGEQQGYMQIFAGSMIGIRNPKAHKNEIIDEQRAAHLLILASLLMHKFDEAQIPQLSRKRKNP